MEQHKAHNSAKLTVESISQTVDEIDRLQNEVRSMQWKMREKKDTLLKSVVQDPNLCHSEFLTVNVRAISRYLRKGR